MKNMNALTKKQKDTTQNTFKSRLSDCLKRRRMQKDYSLEDVAAFLLTSKSTIDRYEGAASIPSEMLPLFAICYEMSISEMMDTCDVDGLTKGFRGLVKIASKAQRRKGQRKQMVIAEKERKRLVTKVYEIDGKLVSEDVEESPDMAERKSFREMCRDGSFDIGYVVPFTDEEFAAYIQTEYPEKVSLLSCAARLIKYSDAVSGKDTMNTMITNFIFDEFIINKLIDNPDDIDAKRAYMYYKSLLETYDKDCGDLDGFNGTGTPDL